MNVGIPILVPVLLMVLILLPVLVITFASFEERKSLRVTREAKRLSKIFLSQLKHGEVSTLNKYGHTCELRLHYDHIIVKTHFPNQWDYIAVYQVVSKGALND